MSSQSRLLVNVALLVGLFLCISHLRSSDVLAQEPTSAESANTEVTESIVPRAQSDNRAEPEGVDSVDSSEEYRNEVVVESSDSWGYLAAIPLPSIESIDAGKSVPLMEFKLGPDVFTHARADLSDLRIFGSGGEPYPYALRVLSPRSVRDIVQSTEFNRSEPEEGEHEVSLELAVDEGAPNAVSHNEVQIVTTGDRFRRAVLVEGSNNGETWQLLVKGHLLRFVDGDQKIDITSLTYSPSRYQYVRVRVQPDADAQLIRSERDEFKFTEVRVLRTNQLPGERSEWTAVVGEREPTRVLNMAGSAWIIDLQGDSVPCDRLEVEVENGEFNRNVEIQVEQLSTVLGQPVFVPLYVEGETNWQRKAGEPKRMMTIAFPEVTARRLRLLVADARNVPLTIRSATVSAAARQVVLQRPPSTEEMLRLYFGNPIAEPPVYDFARNLPEKLAPPPIAIALEAVVPNEDFTPPPVPFTERMPWLVYVVLGAVAMLLLVIIANLAKTSLAIHDTQVADAVSS